MRGCWAMNPSGATFVTKRDANRQENHGVRTDRALNTQWPLPDLCHHSEYRIYVNGQYVENAGSVGSNARHILESWQRSRRVKTVEVWLFPCQVIDCTWGQS